MSKPIRYQCRHIFTDGHRCGSPCLKGEPFCYYHHTTRKPAARQAITDTFDLPLPEDRSSIQAGIGLILQRIANNQLDLRRAGLLLYGLQTASLNLPKPKEEKKPDVVEEVVNHPELGEIAPESDIEAQPNRPFSFARLLMQELEENGDVPQEEDPLYPPNWWEKKPDPQIIPNIQAVAAINSKPSLRSESRHGAPGDARQQQIGVIGFGSVLCLYPCPPRRSAVGLWGELHRTRPAGIE